jgi:hypothetical protein
VPVPVAAPPPVAAPAPEPAKPRAPQFAWKDGLGGLGPMSRVLVEEHAAFVSFTNGVLTLGVRNERHLHKVREHLRDADFGAALPGFRNVLVTLTEEGRTGKEARSQWDEKRRREAQEAADRSDALARLKAAFGGVVESVEPDGASDTRPIEDEVVDE